MRAQQKFPGRWRERVLIVGGVLIFGAFFALAIQAIELAVVIALLGLGLLVLAVAA